MDKEGKVRDNREGGEGQEREGNKGREELTRSTLGFDKIQGPQSPCHQGLWSNLAIANKSEMPK